MKRFYSVVLLIVIMSLFVGIGIQAEETYEYTLMIYLNGSDLETDYESATFDLLEMLDGQIDDDIAVIIETGGTNDWHSEDYGLPNISPKMNQRWRMTEDSLDYLGAVGSQNMGESHTLSDFMDFAINTYPSDQYALILWNHGAGSVHGYGADEKYDYDALTLNELQRALEDNYRVNSQKFDLIGFDACLMGSVETAHVLAPYADWLVASEELEPEHGWSYDAVVTHLSQNKDTTGDAFGEAIVDGFYLQSTEYFTRDGITLSLVDLAAVDGVVEAMDAFFSRVLMDMDDMTLVDRILKLRMEAESYGEASSSGDVADSDMVDMIDYATLMNELYPYQSEMLVLAVEEAVTYWLNSDYKPNANGLSMYMPARDRETMAYAPDTLSGIGLPESYIDFISALDDIINSGVGVEFDDTLTIGEQSSDDQPNFDQSDIEGDSDYFFFQVDMADLDKISQVYTVMGKVDSEEDIQYLAKDKLGDGAILNDGAIIGEPLQEWVSINGRQVAMYYEDSNNRGTENYAIPMLLNGEEADLIVLFSDVYPEGRILGVRVHNTASENVYNRSLKQLKPTDFIEFVYEYDIYLPEEDAYIYDGRYYLDGFYVGDGIELSWRPLEIGVYAYAFQIEDIYGGLYTTNWITYEVDDLMDMEEEAVANPHYPWMVDGADQPSPWAVPFVTTAYNNDLTTEKTITDFTDNITREEFCELAVNLYEKSSGKTIAISSPVVFDDTVNIAVAKAYQMGIVNGYGDGRFGPEDEITREQLITMFFRTLNRLDDRYENLSYPLLTFGDSHHVSEYALMPAQALVTYGLINGVGDNRLAPKDNATIEQALKLVNGVYEFYLTNQPTN